MPLMAEDTGDSVDNLVSHVSTKPIVETLFRGGLTPSSRESDGEHRAWFAKA